MKEPWVVLLSLLTKVWEGCVYIGLNFGAEEQRGLKVCCEDLLGMSFWKSWEGLPNAKISMRSPLHSCLGVGDIRHSISASCRIVYYFACKSLESSIGQTLFVFPLPTKGQRRSWLIQKCLGKINASFKAFWELAGQSSRAGQMRTEQTSSMPKAVREQQWERNLGRELELKGDPEGGSAPVCTIPSAQRDFRSSV